MICAFNEEAGIGAVLEIVSRHPLLNEVIVVDDGSSDDTAEIVRRYPSVQLLSQPLNQGKSAAMATGIAASRAEWLMLLDANLTGLTAAHITALTEPVRSGRAEISLSLRQNSLRLYRALGIDFVSGERVLRRALVEPELTALYGLPRFGVEVFINDQIVAAHLKIAVIDWHGVEQTRKKSYWKNMQTTWRMLTELLEVVAPLTLLCQIWHMRSLRVRSE
ncbi:glycosyltransferase family 2 protein [Paraburkholderia bonniea]|uniref:glycosyltransferase family 2 protein n=1 Tax=Paraburkholderia bonniea TaxID=2152891 RepID=UPI001580BCBD|nr:glycosyltransferase family 2 protein [Paraburkholderia bonniea]WJF95373.1 glycosyltransferase family 2 protein [Paraburkholderia bonniea]